MIEEDIQKLTAAITQLTVTTEALLETLRANDGAAKQQAADDATLKEAAEKLRALGEQKPKKAKAPKAEPTPATEPTPAVEQAPEPAPAAAPEPAKPAVTLQDIRAAAQTALDNGKLNDVVALNKQFGLKRISDASPDAYAEILAKLEEINGQA